MPEYKPSEILSKIWPKWKIVDICGYGTYGEVYRIRRVDVQSGVISSESALKIITIPQNLDEITMLRNENEIEAAKREYASTAMEFSGEIRLLESLKGASSVVHIEDYSIVKNEDGISWTILIRMELLQPLRLLLPLSESEVIKLGIDMCSALEICAKKNIIHRDIKLSNIFCSEYGNYKLGDFGIAKVMESSSLNMTANTGTPIYIAPEVVSGKRYDTRADIYSLGMVLYNLMNDQCPPFYPMSKQILSAKDRSEAYARRINGEEFDLPKNASDELSAIIMKACAFAPEHRFTNPGEMKKELMRLTGEVRTIKNKKTLKGLLPFVSGFACAAVLFGAISLCSAFCCDRAEDESGEIDQISGGPEIENSGDPENRIDVSKFEFEVNADGKGCTLVRLTDTVEKNVVIPSEYNGLPVTKIASHAFVNVMAESITIPDSVVQIEGRAFTGAGWLESLHIPASVTSITYLSSISEEGNPFSYCDSLEVITVDKENPVYHSAGNCIIETATGTLVFGCNTSVIPSDGSVTKIGKCAFYGTSNMLYIDIPEGITAIDEQAFDSSGIESINIPSTVVKIAQNAFWAADSIAEVTVDENNPVYRAENNSIIKGNTLYIGFSTSTVPEGVKKIASYAFSKCNKLYELEIPDGVTSVEQEIFWGSGIRAVSLPSTLTAIHPQSFSTCDFLREITISENNPVYEIVDGCLINKKIKLLLSVLDYAKIPDNESVVEIGESAFFWRDIDDIYIPASVTIISETAFNFANLRGDITVSEDNPVFYSDGNCIIRKSNGELVAGFKKSIIPDDGSVKSIASNAFYGNGVTFTSLPESVTDIGGASISCGEFEEFVLSDSISIIPDCFFHHCYNLKRVFIPNTITDIRDAAFEFCTSLEEVYYGGSEAEWKKINIGNGNGVLDNVKFIYGASSEDMENAG